LLCYASAWHVIALPLLVSAPLCFASAYHYCASPLHSSAGIFHSKSKHGYAKALRSFAPPLPFTAIPFLCCVRHRIGLPSPCFAVPLHIFGPPISVSAAGSYPSPLQCYTLLCHCLSSLRYAIAIIAVHWMAFP
jgi:hypothetical protein